MNIALSTLIVFLLLVPGLIFLRFYYSEEFSKEYFKTTFFEVVASALIPSIALHSIISGIVSLFTVKTTDLVVVGKLISGEKSSVQTGLENIQNNLVSVITYYVVVTFVAALLGVILRKRLGQKDSTGSTNCYAFKTTGTTS